MVAKAEGKRFFPGEPLEGQQEPGREPWFVFWGIPPGLQSFVELLFVYLFIPLPEGRECCPDTSGILNVEDNS